ncbi:hypothetical protein FRB90_004663, partial [Tulasnella sp. 427]
PRTSSTAPKKPTRTSSSSISESRHLDAPDEVLHSLAGSFGYVAPKVLSNKGHSKSVDLWSTGIITYVLLCGYSPFRATDAKELIIETTAGRIEFHERFWKNVSGEVVHHVAPPSRSELSTYRYSGFARQWLTEATAASSEIDIGQGLRQNFDPKAKWKQAIFKVRVNNSLAKLPTSRVGTGGVVKDGRTTSDEEDNDDDDDDDEMSIFEVKKKNGTAGSVDSTSTKSLGGKEDGKLKEVKKEDVKQKTLNEVKPTAQRQPSPSPAPATSSNQPRTYGNGLPIPPPPPERPAPQPSQRNYKNHSHHHDDDSDDEAPSMPGSFHFGSPKRSPGGGGGGGGGERCGRCRRGEVEGVGVEVTGVEGRHSFPINIRMTEER